MAARGRVAGGDLVIGLRRGPTLVRAAGFVACGAVSLLLGLLVEIDGHELAVAFAPGWLVPAGILAWPVLRAHAFLRLGDEGAQVLERELMPWAELRWADVREGNLVLGLTDGPFGLPRGVSVPLRQAAASPDEVLAALEARGVELVPSGLR